LAQQENEQSPEQNKIMLHADSQ